MDQLLRDIGNAIGSVFSSELVQLGFRAIGIYVVVVWLATAFWAYQDMKSRASNPLLPYFAAALIVVFTPILFPFAAVLYRLVRPHERIGEAYERNLAEEAMLSEVESIDHCGGCGRRINEAWIVCPTCRTRLRRVCPSCGKLVGTDWSLCAWCGTDFEVPVPRHATVGAGPYAVPSSVPRPAPRPAAPEWPGVAASVSATAVPAVPAASVSAIAVPAVPAAPVSAQVPAQAPLSRPTVGPAPVPAVAAAPDQAPARRPAAPAPDLGTPTQVPSRRPAVSTECRPAAVPGWPSMTPERPAAGGISDATAAIVTSQLSPNGRSEAPVGSDGPRPAPVSGRVGPMTRSSRSAPQVAADGSPSAAGTPPPAPAPVAPAPRRRAQSR